MNQAKKFDLKLMELLFWVVLTRTAK